ncbi:MAG: acyl-CoA dehydrogenase family protein [Janthinobacterium lividum]
MNSVEGLALLANRRERKPDQYLARAEVAQITASELTRRMTALAPMVEAHAAEAERLRHPVDAVWTAIRRSGFFYQFVPQAFGGMATDLDGYMDAVLPIAEACASTAWTANFCAWHNWALAQFPRETQAEVWGTSPYTIAPLMAAPPGQALRAKGGFRITGQWQWATGIMHADWAFVMAMLEEGGAPQFLFCLVPADDVDILDTWQVDGMCGTGSHDIRISDVFVPENRAIAAFPLLCGQGEGSKLHDSALYRIPMMALSTVTGAMTVLGTARAALRHHRERLGERTQAMSTAKWSDKPAAQIRLAEADLMIGTAETVIRDAGRRAVAAAEVSGPDQVPLRIAVRARSAYAAQLCRKAVHHLAEGAGSSVHQITHPFQRTMRDIDVMTSHVGFDVDSCFELHGRALLSLPPNTPLF